MKKATVLFTLIAISISPLFSQYRYYSNAEQVIDYSSNFYRWGLYKQATANQKITVTGKDKKSKIVSVKTKHFNADSVVTFELYKNGKGKEKVKRLSTYDAKHLMGREVFKNGKLKYTTKNTFEGRYRTSFTKLDGNGKVLTKNENTFTDKEYVTTILNKDYPIYKGKKLKTSISYKKGGEKQQNKWIYEYDAEGKQTVTTYYNAKNKVKFIWDYSCKSEGELLASKNQTNFCTWQESDNGMLMEVTRKTSAKGKIQKTIKIYDADTNIVSSEIYMDEELTQKVNYDKTYSKPLHWENYKKGVLRNRYVYIYAENGKVLNTKSYYKDMENVNYEEKFTYKDDQLIAVENYSKGKLIRSYVISYN